MIITETVDKTLVVRSILFHVGFSVFGFDVIFDEKRIAQPPRLGLENFFDMALQQSNGLGQARSLAQTDVFDDLKTPLKKTGAHIFTCTEGLIPQLDVKKTTGESNEWVVRGATFVFSLSCKFAVKEAYVVTTYLDSDEKPTRLIENIATGTVYSKPMQLSQEIETFKLTVTISPLNIYQATGGGAIPIASMGAL